MWYENIQGILMIYTFFYLIFNLGNMVLHSSLPDIVNISLETMKKKKILFFFSWFSEIWKREYVQETRQICEFFLTANFYRLMQKNPHKKYIKKKMQLIGLAKILQFS